MGIYEKRYVPVHWTLFQYVSPMGRQSIDDWRRSLLGGRRTDFDAFLSNMVRKKTWAPPDVKALHGKQSGFTELRWKSDGIPHRIGGYYAAPDEFVMLIGFTHKTTYDPPEALNALNDRKRRLLNREAKLNEYPVLTGR